ncbi:MAG: DMT family transporter [Sphingomonadales bacterium]|jgi:drug/metabolite transporter (DMT)-like permease
MDFFIFALVLTAAMLHAGWSVIIKAKLDPFASLTLVSTGWSLLAVPALFFVAPPTPILWLFVAGSVAIHLIYKVILSATFAAGDLGQVYPIARGSGPLLTIFGAAVIAGEHLAGHEILGAVLIVSGVMLVSLRGSTHFERRAVGFALATGLCIASYTLLDGLGVRYADSPWTFVTYLFVLDGGSMFFYALYRQGPKQIKVYARHWPIALIGGAMALTAYAISLWAMTQAPIGLVAAIRESSVLFAAIFGMIFLKERLTVWRAIAAIIIVAGIALTKVSF